MQSQPGKAEGRAVLSLLGSRVGKAGGAEGEGTKFCYPGFFLLTILCIFVCIIFLGFFSSEDFPSHSSIIEEENQKTRRMVKVIIFFYSENLRIKYHDTGNSRRVCL